jgi:hypothetical protein
MILKILQTSGFARKLQVELVGCPDEQFVERGCGGGDKNKIGCGAVGWQEGRERGGRGKGAGWEG